MAMNMPPVGQSDDPQVMMDINTTPLIDVMLVLLVMLIITIPLQLHSVNLDMPVASGKPPSKPPVVVKIDINAESVIHWNGQAMATAQELEARLNESAALQPQPELHIRSHGNARYEATTAVLSGAQRAGLLKLGIVGTEQFAH